MHVPNAVLVAAIAALLIGCSDDGRETAVTPVPTVASVIGGEPRVAVQPPRAGLDHVLLLGAPYGVEDRGVLLTVELTTGAVTQRVHGGELWPPGFKEPTVDRDHPVAEAASRSPDGLHVAVFARAADTRKTGVTIISGDETRFHHLQSVGSLVGGRLAWSPASDAVYLLAATAEGSADRVIGIPLVGSPQTVVRLDERGYTWLAVR